MRLAPETAPKTTPRDARRVVLEQNYRTLVQAAMFMRASQDEAKAAVHQVAIRYLGGRERAIENPLAYLSVAVANQIRQTRRSERRRPPTFELDEALEQSLPGRLDQAFTVWEQQTYVDQVLQQLSPKQRQVMRYIIDGLSTQEIAELMGATEATVRSNARHGRNTLRTALAHQERHQNDSSPAPTATGKGEQP